MEDPASRVATRARLGPLRRPRVGASSHARYLYAGASTDKHTLDRQLCAWIEDHWLSCEGKSLVGEHHLRRAILHHAASHLRRCTEPLRCLGAPRSATPRSSSSSRCPVSFLWSGSFLGATSNWRRSCCCSGFSYLSAESLAWSRFRGPKCGARHGAQEIVTIGDPTVKGLLFHLRNSVEPEDLVCPAGDTGLRAFFPKAADLHDQDLRPYSLRGGGATNDYLLHANLLKTILRGKWSDLRSARIHINDAFSMQAEVHLDPLVHSQVLEFRNIFADRLAHSVALSTQRRYYQVVERGKTHVF